MDPRPTFVLLLAATSGALLGGCGTSSPSISEVETQIKSDLGRQLTQAQAGAEVSSLTCVRKGDADEGRCVAALGGAASGSLPLKVTFGDDGRFLWEAEGGDLASAVATLAAAQTGATADGATASADEASAGSTAPGLAADLAAVKAALEAGNREVEVDDEGNPDNGILADVTAGGVTISFYEEEATARADYAAITGVFKSLPGRGIVRRHGTRLYQIAEERKLTSDEKRELSEVEGAAEAALR